MKGVIFTEFLEMVEDRFGLEVADRIINDAALPSEGAYTAVGTYDPVEMVMLTAQLSRATGRSPADLLQDFGKHLFGRFVTGYPMFFERASSTFDFLAQVENHIHVEVLKLYPDAEMPTFEYERQGPQQMVMIYRSKRAMGDLAEGLIRGCAEHFNEPIEIKREDLSQGRGTDIRFTVQRR